MDIEKTVRHILEQFQAIAHQLPRLVIQIDGKQIGVFFANGKEYKIDEEKRQKIIRWIQNQYRVPIDREFIFSLIDDLEKEYYLNRMETTIPSNKSGSSVNVFFVWKGYLNNEQQKRIYSATKLWYRMELKIDFVNLDDGLINIFNEE